MIDMLQDLRFSFRELRKKPDFAITAVISLVGANRNNTIIDATGLKNGIYVDGMDNAGLTGVSVSGFKVQNANFEGILVTNASGVTTESTRYRLARIFGHERVQVPGWYSRSV